MKLSKRVIGGVEMVKWVYDNDAIPWTDTCPTFINPIGTDVLEQYDSIKGEWVVVGRKQEVSSDTEELPSYILPLTGAPTAAGTSMAMFDIPLPDEPRRG